MYCPACTHTHTHCVVNSYCRRYAGQVALSQGDDGAGPSSSGAAAAAAAAGSSKQEAAAGSSKGKRSRAGTKAGGGGSSRAAAAAAGEQQDPDEEVDPVTGQSVRAQGWWTCQHCTLRNDNIASDMCEVCGLPRYDDDDDA
jgi:hypothetical protein